MKRTQQSVILGLLALSLAACSYMPWKNNNGTSPSATPGATPSSGTSTSGSTGSGNPPNDPGPNASAKNTSSAVGASGEN